MEHGLDLDVVGIGSRAPTLAKLLSSLFGWTASSRRFMLHLCKTSDCVGLDGTNSEPLPRVHAVAICPCYREDLKETWTQEGLAKLQSALEIDPLVPEMRRAPVATAESSSRRSRVSALAEQVGPPGEGDHWQASRLRLETSADPVAPTAKRTDAPWGAYMGFGSGGT